MTLRPSSTSSVHAHALNRRTLLRRLAGGGLAAAGMGTAVHSAPALAQPATSVVASADAIPTGGAEVLWDTWGVPHIYAEDAPGLFYAFGWAQAHNHGDLLLQLYAQARGRGPRSTARSTCPGTEWYGRWGCTSEGRSGMRPRAQSSGPTSTPSPPGSTPTP